MSTTPTFKDTFTSLSLWNGITGNWQPVYDWSPNGYIDSTTSSWLVNPAYGPTSMADADVYSINGDGLNMAIKPLPADVPRSAVGGAQFLSGQLETQPSFSQTYGYFQMTAELPVAAAGIGSAFWLLPENGSWPPEIDIFEQDGSQGPNALEFGAYTGTANDPQQSNTWNYNLPNLTTSYNTFALNWTSSTMTWYVDGQAVYQIATPSQMNQAMYMVIDDQTNNGGWNGAAPTGYSGDMSIKSVYAFDNMADAETAGVVPGYGGSSSSDGSGNGGTDGGTSAGGSTGTTSTGTTGTGTTGTGSSSSGETGTQTASPAPAPTNPAAVVVGNGTDQLIVTVSADAYANGDGTSDAAGDASFTISVDGKQVGGSFITTASSDDGETQKFVLNGNWGIGEQNVTVNFTNYVYGGPSNPDANGSWGRNLYVDGISYDGVNQNETAALYGDGSTNYTASAATPAAVASGSGPDKLVLTMAEDSYLNGDGTSDAAGDAAFTVTVNGVQAGTFITEAQNGDGQSQTFTLSGNWGADPTVAVSYNNYVYGGPSDPDVNGSWARNLYIDGISYNGVNQNVTAADYGDQTQSYTLTGLGATGSATTTPTPIVVAASNADPVELVSNRVITASAGSHLLFIGGSGNTAMLTGGKETVQAFQGGNAITTGALADTIQIAGTGNVVNAGAGSNTIDDSGSHNTIILPTAQNGHDTIYGYVMQNSDTFDLRLLLGATQWDGSQSTIGNFVRMSTSGSNAVISVTPAGAVSGGKYAVATLEGSGAVSLQTLLAHAIT